MIEQEIQVLKQADGQYHNFFYYENSFGGFKIRKKEGWHIKFIRDDGQTATIIWEREKLWKSDDIEQDEPTVTITRKQLEHAWDEFKYPGGWPHNKQMHEFKLFAKSLGFPEEK